MNIRTPGRVISVGEACMKRNPDLFRKLDPDAQAILNNTPLKKKRIRQSSKPLLNKLEQEFYEHISVAGTDHILKQAVRFRLANGLWYKPDFVIWVGRICYEVKGPHSFRGGFENLKMAATTYPEFMWMLAWKENGEWQFQRVLP